MSRGPGVRQADLERAIRAIEATGQGVARIEVRAGGVVWVVPGPALTDAQPPAEVDELEAWRAQRAARSAQGT